MTSRYDEVWRAAEPDLRVRKNDAHVPISYGYAQTLLGLYPETDMSRAILQELNWPEATVAAVGEIIDGHDWRKLPRSLNDRLARDADKLWRFTVTGVAVACDWLKLTPRAYADLLIVQLDRMETEAGRRMAQLPSPPRAVRQVPSLLTCAAARGGDGGSGWSVVRGSC